MGTVWLGIKADEKTVQRVRDLVPPDLADIRMRDGGLYLCCELPESISDQSAAEAVALNNIALIKGAVSLVSDSCPRIETTGGVDCDHPDGTRRVTARASTSFAVDGQPETDDHDPRLRALFRKPETVRSLHSIIDDHRVRQALAYWEGTRDFRDLYCVLEIFARDIPGGRKGVAKVLGEDPAEVVRFAHTADCFYRHAGPPRNPPEKPMNLTQARELFERLLKKWLLHKMQHPKTIADKP